MDGLEYADNLMQLRQSGQSAYEALGTSQNATDDELKQAHRKIIEETNPDRTKNLPPKEQAAARHRHERANSAYDILKDQEMRVHYDRYDHNPIYANNVNQLQQSGQTAYEALGVSKDASNDDIKKAYRKIAGETHADRIKDLSPQEQTAAKQRYEKANSAYDVLKDAETRSLYDRYENGPVNRTNPRGNRGSYSHNESHSHNEPEWKSSVKPNHTERGVSTHVERDLPSTRHAEPIPHGGKFNYGTGMRGAVLVTESREIYEGVQNGQWDRVAVALADVGTNIGGLSDDAMVALRSMSPETAAKVTEIATERLGVGALAPFLEASNLFAMPAFVVIQTAREDGNLIDSDGSIGTKGTRFTGETMAVTAAAGIGIGLTAVGAPVVAVIAAPAVVMLAGGDMTSSVIAQNRETERFKTNFDTSPNLTALLVHMKQHDDMQQYLTPDGKVDWNNPGTESFIRKKLDDMTAANNSAMDNNYSPGTAVVAKLTHYDENPSTEKYNDARSDNKIVKNAIEELNQITDENHRREYLRNPEFDAYVADKKIENARQAADAFMELKRMGSEPSLDPTKIAEHLAATRKAEILKDPAAIAQVQATLKDDPNYKDFVERDSRDILITVTDHIAKRDLAPATESRKQELIAQEKTATESTPQHIENELRFALGVKFSETLTQDLIVDKFKKLQTPEARDRALAALDKANYSGNGTIIAYQRDENGAMKYARENGRVVVGKDGQPIPLVQEGISSVAVKSELDKYEQQAAKEKALILADKNHDGKIDKTEYDKAKGSKQYGDDFTKALTVAMAKSDQDILKGFKLAMENGKLTPTMLAQADVSRAAPVSPDTQSAGATKSNLAI